MAVTSPDIDDLLARMADPALRTAEVVDRYYTLCIPFYREFLGAHWHTGFYEAEGPIGPRDQWRMEAVIAASVQLSATDRAIDVGCGMGGPACHLARLTGAHMLGVTPNAVQLDLACELARQQGVHERVSFVQGRADALPCPDASVDVLLFFESACHFPDRRAFFREAHRVLKPGGRLAGEDWLASEGLSASLIERHVRAIGHTWCIPALGTLSDYAADMQAAGLTVTEAVDMRQEMALHRGFIVHPRDRAVVAMEMRATADPIRRVIMDGLLRLGEATEAGAFTVGRFVARKPEQPA